MSSLFYVLVSRKTVLIPLRQLYPECQSYLVNLPAAENLQCLREGRCSVDKGCMPVLAERVHKFFMYHEPSALQLLAYYKTPSGSIRAGVFTRQVDEPRVITCNQHGLQKLQKIGAVKEWTPDDSFYGNLVSPSSLIRP